MRKSSFDSRETHCMKGKGGRDEGYLKNEGGGGYGFVGGGERKKP